VTIPVTVNLVSADEAAAAETDHEVTEEVVVLMSARAQEQAREHADRGEFDAATKVLGEAASELRKVAPGSAQAAELLAQAEMLEENLTWMSDERYRSASKKAMLYQMVRAGSGGRSPRPRRLSDRCPISISVSRLVMACQCLGLPCPAC
jgi:hypothetical protein